MLLEANRPTVETEDGTRYLCYLRGKIKRDHGRILVGDRVDVTPTDPGEAIITAILPRSNQLVRPPMANLSGMFVVFSLFNPKGSWELLDKRLVMSQIMGMEAEIIITKTDLLPGDEDLAQLIRLYRSIGYRVWPLSSVDREGLEEFMQADRRGVWVLVGESGAGKSSLIKVVLPHEDIVVQELSRIGRGQQTTRWVRLLKMRDYWMADTPGYTALETVVSDAAIIRNAFWEWEDAGCRFKSCLHLDEPGCNVRLGIAAGRYSAERYAHYKTMLEQWLKRY